MKTNLKSPINIAPFVDVLLVLFVILVVASRFDDNKIAEDKISSLESKIEEQVKIIKSLGGSSSEEKALNEQSINTEKKEGALKINNTLDDITSLKAEIERLTIALKKRQGKNDTRVVDTIYIDGDSLSINGKKVSAEFLRTFLKVSQNTITITNNEDYKSMRLAEVINGWADDEGYGGNE